MWAYFPVYTERRVCMQNQKVQRVVANTKIKVKMTQGCKRCISGRATVEWDGKNVGVAQQKFSSWLQGEVTSGL